MTRIIELQAEFKSRGPGLRPPGPDLGLIRSAGGGTVCGSARRRRTRLPGGAVEKRKCTFINQCEEAKLIMTNIRSFLLVIIFWQTLVQRCHHARGCHLIQKAPCFPQKLVWTYSTDCKRGPHIFSSVILLRGGGPKTYKTRLTSSSKYVRPTTPKNPGRQNSIKNTTNTSVSKEQNEAVERGILERNLWFAAEVQTMFEIVH